MNEYTYLLIKLDRFSHALPVDSKQCEPIVGKLPSIIQWRRPIFKKEKLSEGSKKLDQGHRW